MNTHLSEASVNALLTLVKGAKTSGSYADKINILEKAGVLHGGQKYSNRAPAAPMPAEAGAAAPAAGVGYWLDGQVEARIKQELAKLKILGELIKAHKTKYGGSAADWYEGGGGYYPRFLAFGENSINLTWLTGARLMAEELDQKAGGGTTKYQDALNGVAAGGFTNELRLLVAYTKSTNPDPIMLAEILLALTLFSELLAIAIETLIMEGPNYLSTIPDGTYSFTVYPQSTTQQGILTGTAVVSSQKDIYPGIVVQKLINS